jgi:hypothetical protein
MIDPPARRGPRQIEIVRLGSTDVLCNDARRLATIRKGETLIEAAGLNHSDRAESDALYVVELTGGWFMIDRPNDRLNRQMNALPLPV